MQRLYCVFYNILCVAWYNIFLLCLLSQLRNTWQRGHVFLTHISINIMTQESRSLTSSASPQPPSLSPSPLLQPSSVPIGNSTSPAEANGHGDTRPVFFFDIDNCLYPRSYKIHDMMKDLIHKYFVNHLGMLFFPLSASPAL